MSNQNYSLIISSLHGYLVSREKWPLDVDGLERTRIVVIGLAVSTHCVPPVRYSARSQAIIAQGPKEQLTRRVVGDVVFAFMKALAHRRDWAAPNAVIEAKDFFPDGIDLSEDRIWQQVQSMGFAEFNRRSIDVLEGWREGSSRTPTTDFAAGNGASPPANVSAPPAALAEPVVEKPKRRLGPGGKSFILIKSSWCDDLYRIRVPSQILPCVPSREEKPIQTQVLPASFQKGMP
jgi:hypothetical protein